MLRKFKENTFTVLTEKHLCVSGPMPFKPVLFKSQRYFFLFLLLVGCKGINCSRLKGGEMSVGHH